MPWQIRLGNLPATVIEGEPTELDARFDPAKLRPRRASLASFSTAICSGTSFPDATIHRVLDVVDQVAVNEK